MLGKTEGVVEARNLAKSVSICNDIASVLPFSKETENTWFYHPFHYKGNTFQDLSSLPTNDADPLDVDFEIGKD